MKMMFTHLVAMRFLLTTILTFSLILSLNLAQAQTVPSSVAPNFSADRPKQSGCPAFVPRVDPWRLQRPVLLGDAQSSYYYQGVILAGTTEFVEAFLDCYDLTVRYERNYASAYPIWAACSEVNGGGLSQTVCVAVDSQGRAADERVFDANYANRVAGTVFNLD